MPTMHRLRQGYSRYRWFLAVGAALSSVAPIAPAAAQAVTATGTATASVVQPLAVITRDHLDFGTVAGSGTITIAPLTSATVYAGGVAGLCGTACQLPHAARFDVAGEPGRDYAVSTPAVLHVAPEGGGAGTMRVDSLTVATASRPGESRGVLDHTGRDRFEVGGTLHLPAAASPGRYVAQVPVTVSYF